MTRLTARLTIIGAAVVYGSAYAQVTLSTGERRCVTAMNKGYARMADKYGSALSRCLADATAPGATESFDDCVAAARATSRVARIETVLGNIEAKHCGVPPAYAFTGATTVADAAVDQELEIVSMLFGGDLGLAASTAAGECQVRVLKAAQRCRKIVARSWNKCKKKAIRETSDSGEPPGEWLAGECMHEGIITENRLTGKPRGLSRKCRRDIGRAVNDYCDLPEIPQVFPGDCGSDPSFALCVRDEVPRSVCRGLDVADALGVDGLAPGHCDIFND